MSARFDDAALACVVVVVLVVFAVGVVVVVAAAAAAAAEAERRTREHDARWVAMAAADIRGDTRKPSAIAAAPSTTGDADASETSARPQRDRRGRPDGRTIVMTDRRRAPLRCGPGALCGAITKRGAPCRRFAARASSATALLRRWRDEGAPADDDDQPRRCHVHEPQPAPRWHPDSPPDSPAPPFYWSRTPSPRSASPPPPPSPPTPPFAYGMGETTDDVRLAWWLCARRARPTLPRDLVRAVWSYVTAYDAGCAHGCGLTGRLPCCVCSDRRGNATWWRDYCGECRAYLSARRHRLFVEGGGDGGGGDDDDPATTTAAAPGRRGGSSAPPPERSMWWRPRVPPMRSSP